MLENNSSKTKESEISDNIADVTDADGGDVIPEEAIAKIKALQDQIKGEHITIFPNPEKSRRVRLGPEEYMPYSSSRILLSAMPNCGKRNTILNIIHRMDPLPSHCHIVHCDPLTIEYDCLADLGIPVSMYEPEDFPMIKNIDDPDEDESAGEDEDPEAAREKLQNPLVIVDECTQDQLGKEGSHRLERLVNHICTHRNTTLICSIQSILNLPPKARRGFNHLVLWKQADKDVNRMSAQRASIDPAMLEDMFELCETKYDHIWIDLDEPHDSPWRYRLNFIWPIRIERARD
jgi:hypothetical protein